mmetsp:Transcript_29090/g.81988  ORF Transcript_29090/g.81988 Transcript_29090/m.81988 type:complete len:242 (+) Transcript_29090:139-864(+)
MSAAVGLLPAFRKLYRRAGDELETWETLQMTGESQLSTITNVLERLPVLREEENFGLLRGIEGLPEKVLAKQLVVLEGLFKSLRGSMLVHLAASSTGGLTGLINSSPIPAPCFNSALSLFCFRSSEMESVVTSFGRLAQDGAKLLPRSSATSQRASTATPFLQSGATPSTSECCEGLQDIWLMLKSELALKDALVKSVTYESTPAELSHIVACFQAQPNVDKQRIQDLLYVVMSTEPRDKL